MKYYVVWKRSALAELEKLPPALMLRIDEATFGLDQEPRPHGCKSLAGSPYYRIRIGDYRLVYSIEDSGRVHVLRVAHRREVYR